MYVERVKTTRRSRWRTRQRVCGVKISSYTTACCWVSGGGSNQCKKILSSDEREPHLWPNMPNHTGCLGLAWCGSQCDLVQQV